MLSHSDPAASDTPVQAGVTIPVRPALSCASSFIPCGTAVGECTNAAFEICEGSTGSFAVRESQATKPAGKDSAATAWRCAPMRRLGVDSNCSLSTALTSVWHRWATCLESIAGEHVCTSCERLLSGLADASITSGAGTTSTVDVALALAGIGAADHEATMRQTELICRERFPGRCVALVGPNELDSLVTATRHIAEQFMRTSSSQEAHSRGSYGSDEDEEEESPEDND